MQIRHDSRNSFDRSPLGAIPCGGRVRLRIRVEGDCPDAVVLRSWTDHEQRWDMQPSGVYEGAWLFEQVVTMPVQAGLFWYDFRIHKGDHCLAYGNAPDQLGGEGAVWPEPPPSYQITVYDDAVSPPEWMRDAVIYQIFPDRFAKGTKAPKRGVLPAEVEAERYRHSTWDALPRLEIDPVTGDNCAMDFFGGTLSGIEEKLPYLKSLGVTALYLNPIFFARTNHRYDTNDYRRIDPWLGQEQDLVSLCEAAKAQGMRVLLDGVFSHTGADSVYFRQAQQDRHSPYYSWYHFTHWPDRYESWWGFTTLPETNELDPGFVNFMLQDEDAVVPHWLNAGAGGWRLDVADELPMPFLRMLRIAAKRAKPDAAIIGEVWEDASNKVAYGQLRSYCLGDTLDSVMNYPLREELLSFFTGTQTAGDTARRISALYEQYPKPFAYALMNLLGSHDRPRVLNILCGVTGENLPRNARGKLQLSQAERTLAMARLRQMASFLLVWPGMPTIYYGDEAGMEGAADPYCRRTYPWGHEDQALVAFFQSKIALRQAHPVLRTGEARLAAPHTDVLCIYRWIQGGQDALGAPAADAAALLIINRGGQPLTVNIASEALDDARLVHAETGEVLTPFEGLYRVTIPAQGAELWLDTSI